MARKTIVGPPTGKKRYPDAHEKRVRLEGAMSPITRRIDASAFKARKRGGRHSKEVVARIQELLELRRNVDIEVPIRNLSLHLNMALREVIRRW